MATPTGNGIPGWYIYDSLYTVQLFNNITSVRLFKGRRKLTDNYSSGTATITGRRPDLQTSVTIGQSVLVICFIPGGDTFGDAMYGFRIADYRINYGTIAAEDTWELELEDAFAYLGRASLNTTTITAGTATNTAAYNIATSIGLGQTTYGTVTTTTSGQTVTNQNALDVYQTLVNTEGAQVWAGGDGIDFYARNYWIYNSSNSTFTDTGAANTFKFTEYESRSLADNYADKVTVTPRGSSDVVSGTGIFSYNLDAYAFDTQQAQNLADFTRGALDVDYTSPTRVGFLVNGQDTTIFQALIGPRRITVTFRGSTTVNQLVGFSVFATPEETRAEMYLTSSAFFNYLILNDTTYGKLDFNRLGW